MGLLAVRFQEDEARGKAMGVALGCTGIGALSRSIPMVHAHCNTRMQPAYLQYFTVVYI